MALGCALTLFTTSVALADDVTPDGDGTAPVALNDLAFGNVCLNETSDPETALVAIKRGWGDDNPNDPLRVFGNSEAVNISISSIGHADLSASMGSDSTIFMPSDWLDVNEWASGDIYQGDTAEVNVSVTPTSLGFSGSQTVTIRASGDNPVGSPISRTVQQLKVTWTGIDCSTYQPDFRVRKLGGPPKGNNIYNTSAAGQRVTAGLEPGTTRQMVLTVQNDGNAPDSFQISLISASSAGSGLTVTYMYGWPGTDVTTAVNNGTLTTPTLAPGAIYYFRVYVQAAADAPLGSFREDLLEVESMTDGSKVDRVAWRRTVV